MQIAATLHVSTGTKFESKSIDFGSICYRNAPRLIAREPLPALSDVEVLQTLKRAAPIHLTSNLYPLYPLHLYPLHHDQQRSLTPLSGRQKAQQN